MGKLNMKKLMEKKYYIIYAILAIISFLGMLYHADEGSLWYDEMFSLGYAFGNADPNSSYITFALMRWWVRVIPYGQIYIYMLSIIFTALTVFVIGVMGKRLRNGMTGVYSSAIVALSPYIWRQVAFEYRMYFMLFFLCTLVFYLFLARETSKYANAWWYIFLYSIVNMLVMDSQEYGKLVAGAIILIDVILILRKQISVKYVASFIMPIFYGIYWLLNNEVGHLWNNYSWPENPTMYSVRTTILKMLGESNFLLLFFAVGVIYAAIYVFGKNHVEKIFSGSKLGYFTAVYLITGIFSASVVYSNFINPENSLYVTRYFISVLPYIIVIVATGLDWIVEVCLIGMARDIRAVVYASAIVIVLYIGWNGYYVIPEEHNQPYRQSAEYLRTEEEVYKDDVVVFIPENGYVGAAWNYYFSGGEEGNEINILNRYNMDLENCNYRRIYVVAPAYNPTEEQQAYLDENYQLIQENTQYSIKVYELRK